MSINLPDQGYQGYKLDTEPTQPLEGRHDKW